MREKRGEIRFPEELLIIKEQCLKLFITPYYNTFISYYLSILLYHLVVINVIVSIISVSGH